MLYKILYTFTRNHFNYEVHMRANAVILIVIGLLLLVGTAGAVITVQVSGNQSWLVAGSGSSAAYTVTVTNTTSGSVPIDGASITFSVDPLYGTMSPATVTTNSAGQAFSTFAVNTKSGVAPIIASISYSGSNGPFTMTRTIPQNIDHGSPFYDFTISPPLFTYPATGTVASQVPFKVQILDKWGNPIDNRNPSYTHNVGLHASSALSPTEPFFVGYGQDLIQPLDANGTLSVNVRLTTKTGSNKILMDSFEGKISTQIVWITAMAESMPYSMTGSISDGGVLPADNNAKFTIDYYLYDIYGNPITNRNLVINTDLPGETTPTSYTPDSNGLIRFYYGPKVSLFNVTITAKAADNSSVFKILYANFVSSSASNMILAITPQTMASRETKPTQTAEVIGKVYDSWGNPVSGQTVNFTISNPQNGTYRATSYGSFSSSGGLNPTLTATAVTDKNGNAIVTFYPGSFPIWNEPGFSPTAEGTCEVTGTWNSQTSPPITLEWKNYPYISVATNVTPQTVRVNDTVDITIRVTADGYLMKGGPIVAMLDLDASSSLNSGARGPDAKAAAKRFVDNFSTTQDQIGLVSYGDGDNDVLHYDPTNVTADYTFLKYAIDNLTLHGGVSGQNAITVKQSVDEGVSRIINNPIKPAGAVQAIILLGDSAYDSGELPYLVRTTWGNESMGYGNDHHNIRVFTIMYLSSSGGCGSTTDSKLVRMRELGQSAGGKYYCGGSRAEIDAIFDDVAQTLRDIAAVNSSMNLNFENVYVNSTNSTGMFSGGEVFDYVPVDLGYASPDSRTTILWQNNTRSFKNQSNEWTAANNYNLNFDIGTMKIGNVWEAKFRLKVKKEGVISLFNCSSSSVLFNDGSSGQTMCIPDTYLISVTNITPVGLQTGTLSLDLLSPNGQNYNTSVPMQWDLSYTGFDKVTETYWYSFRNQPFVQFGGKSNIPNGTFTPLTYPNYTTIDLDVKNFPAGDYQVKVIASVPGIPSVEDTGSFTKFYDNASVNILLR